MAHLYRKVAFDLLPTPGTHLDFGLVLRHFKLYRWDIKDLSPLAKLTRLDTLYLHNTNVTDIEPLADLKSLVKLDLYNLEIDDVQPLMGLENLRELYVYDTNFKPEDIDRLRKHLPKCTIGFRNRGSGNKPKTDIP